MTFNQWWGVYWQYFAVFAGGAVWTFLVVAITAVRKDYAWRHTISNHLGDITKSEIGKRDEQIAKQSFKLAEQYKLIKALREKVQTMAALATQQVDTAGNTYRGGTGALS